MWNLPAPSGFQGLRDDVPLSVYRQTLPHWRQDGATYFVTFRLADSLPQSKLHALREFKTNWERNSRSRSETGSMELMRETMRRVERWLDQGMGSCALKTMKASSTLAEILHAGDDKHYELGCYVVMPNHVHAVVKPVDPVNQPLEMILKKWKAASACEINRQLKRSQSLWQRDNYDRIIRDEEHLYRVIQYIGRNPRLARLSQNKVPRWVRPAWIECGWDFESAS